MRDCSETESAGRSSMTERIEAGGHARSREGATVFPIKTGLWVPDKGLVVFAAHTNPRCSILIDSQNLIRTQELAHCWGCMNNCYAAIGDQRVGIASSVRYLDRSNES